MAKGLFEQAIEELSEGLKSEPNNAAFYELLGTAYYSQNDAKAAGRANKRAIELDETSMKAYQLLGIESLSKGEYLRTVSFFRRALRDLRALFLAWRKTSDIASQVATLLERKK